MTEDSLTLSTDQPVPFPTKKKITSSKDSTDELVGLATAYFKKPETESDFLAKGWTMKLNRLQPDQRCFAEKIINDTLLEAEMGTLTRHGVSFLTSSQSILNPSPTSTYYPSSFISSSPLPTLLPSAELSPSLMTHTSPQQYVTSASYIHQN